MAPLSSTVARMGRARKKVSDTTYGGKLAIRVRLLRERAGLTVDELSAKTGVPTKTIYSWESGHRNLGIDDCVTLAQALGVKPADFFPPRW